MKNKTTDLRFSGKLSVGTWMSVCRFQLYFLSTDGGQKVSREHLAFMRLVPDARLIGSQMQNSAN